MMKTKKKNVTAMALADLSRQKRMKTMTPEQRSEQARRAVAARRDRQQKGPWYGLFVLPADFRWKGMRKTAKEFDELLSDTGNVVCWSQDKTKVISRSQEPDFNDRETIIIEQDWDPHALRVVREYTPVKGRQISALQTKLDRVERR